MPLRGDYLEIRVQRHSSGVTNETIAESTSVSVAFSAGFLETTSTASGIYQSGIGGKVSGTVSGDYLLASAGTQFSELFALMQAGDTFEIVLYKSSAVWITTSGVMTSLDLNGGTSDSLVTGSYSINITGTVTVA